jgi:hypothetical protein
LYLRSFRRLLNVAIDLFDDHWDSDADDFRKEAEGARSQSGTETISH